MPAQTPVALAQHLLDGGPVELQKVEQPAGEVRIAAGTAQRHALQQPQGGGGRQPAVPAHPAVDAEQGEGQPPAVEADGDQMGEGALRPGTPEQMQMAVFAIAAMAVVVALAATARIDQISVGVVLLLQRGGSAGEDPHQRAVALDNAEPVMQRQPRRSIAGDLASGDGIHLQREGPQPPS